MSVPAVFTGGFVVHGFTEPAEGDPDGEDGPVGVAVELQAEPKATARSNPNTVRRISPS